MVKKRGVSQPANFIDLRQASPKRITNLIDDVRWPQGRQRLGRRSRYAVVVTGLLATLLIVGLTQRQAPASPVPAAIRQAVSFPVYYPATSKLPAGYSFDPSSLSAASGAVVLHVQTPAGQTITISEQMLPSAQALTTFVNQRLPLHTDVSTPIGTASIGALNAMSFSSLPATHTWLLISAPYNIDQAQLKQVLRSLTD